MILNLNENFKPIIGDEIQFESFWFSGGEPHIRIKEFDTSKKVFVSHRINSFNDLGLLTIAIDALRRMGVKEINLFIPYFPGARQDRLMVPGESLTVKVYADLINRLELKSVSVLDPHSEVTPSFLDNCKVLSNYGFIKEVLEHLPAEFILISPDAGAAKKIHALAKSLGHTKIMECTKKRDVVTGKLSGFNVPASELNQQPCLIVDDICDGGGTFIGLAKELKEKNAGELYLAVSHGIFSKGLEELSHIFSKIFTTDSIKEIEDKSVHQISLRELLNKTV